MRGCRWLGGAALGAAGAIPPYAHLSSLAATDGACRLPRPHSRAAPEASLPVSPSGPTSLKLREERIWIQT